MAEQKTEIKKPANTDIERARRIMEKVIRENKEWLKEMADK